LAQRRGGTLSDEPAMVDDRDPVGDALVLLYEVKAVAEVPPRLSSGLRQGLKREALF
jgi:hypothetical protein